MSDHTDAGQPAQDLPRRNDSHTELGIFERMFPNVIRGCIALTMVGTLCFLLVTGKDGLLGSFMNLLFVAAGHFFRGPPPRAGLPMT